MLTFQKLVLTHGRSRSHINTTVRGQFFLDLGSISTAVNFKTVGIRSTFTLIEMYIHRGNTNHDRAMDGIDRDRPWAKTFKKDALSF